MTTLIRSAVGSVSSMGLLKFFKENGFAIAATDLTDEVAAKYFVGSIHIVPKAESMDMPAAYEKIINETKATWILSGPENEIIELSKNKQRFEALGCTLFHPDEDVLKIITDKWACYNFLKSIGILCPDTINFSDYNGTSPFPGKYVIKPKMGRGGSGIYFDSNPNHLELYQKLVNPANYIIQKYINGEEFTTDLLYDTDGRLLNLVSRKRLKTDSGISIVGQTVLDEKIIEIVTLLSEKLKFIGGNCIQFIRDAEGKYYLTDINPRLGGGSILSIKSSPSFAANIVNLLNKKGKLLYNSFDFEPLKMLRYYEEIYEH